MCDRSLCRSGYVGSLLNLPSATADSFYFPSLRAANGGHQLAASLPYPRSSLAWSCASSYPAQPAGHAFSTSPQPPPYLAAATGPLPLNLNSSSSSSSSKASSSDGPHKYYVPEGASKQDERGRQSREATALASRPGETPSPAKVLKGEPRSWQGAPAALGNTDSCASGLKGDRKHAVNLNLTLPPAAAAQPSLRPSLQDGTPP